MTHCFEVYDYSKISALLLRYLRRDKIPGQIMIPGEHDKIYRCERCDRETPHVVESMGDDNRLHHLCWDCVGREEKRFNQKPGWRRTHRTRRYEPLQPPPAPQGVPDKPKIS